MHLTHNIEYPYHSSNLSISYFVRPQFTHQIKDEKIGKIGKISKIINFKAKKGKNKYNVFER